MSGMVATWRHALKTRGVCHVWEKPFKTLDAAVAYWNWRGEWEKQKAGWELIRRRRLNARIDQTLGDEHGGRHRKAHRAVHPSS